MSLDDLKSSLEVKPTEAREGSWEGFKALEIDTGMLPFQGELIAHVVLLPDGDIGIGTQDTRDDHHQGVVVTSDSAIAYFEAAIQFIKDSRP